MRLLHVGETYVLNEEVYEASLYRTIAPVTFTVNKSGSITINQSADQAASARTSGDTAVVTVENTRKLTDVTLVKEDEDHPEDSGIRGRRPVQLVHPESPETVLPGRLKR